MNTLFKKKHTLKSRAIFSSSHIIVSLGFSNILRLLSNLILTRLLFPEAFGIMMLVQNFLYTLIMLSDIGINTSIIKAKDINDQNYLDTAWSLKVLRGFGIFLFTFVVAYPMSIFYEYQELTYLIPLVGFSIFIIELSPLKATIAERKLKMGAVVYWQLLSQLLATLATCLCAYFYPNVISLTVGSIVSSIFLVSIYRTQLDGANESFRLHTKYIPEFIHFGKWILLASTAGLIANSAHKFILGKYLPPELFGIFAVATVLGQLPEQLTTKITNKVLLPLYSELNRNENNASIKKIRFTLLICALSAIILFQYTSPAIFRYLYDSRYYDAGFIAAIISFISFPTVLSSTLSTVYLSKGKSKSFSNLVITRSIILCFFAALLVPHFGLLGVLAAVFISNICEYLKIFYDGSINQIVNRKKDFMLMLLWLLSGFIFSLTHEEKLLSIFTNYTM